MDSKGVVGDEPGGLIMREDSSDEAFCAILSADAERSARNFKWTLAEVCSSPGARQEHGSAGGQ